MLSIRGKNGSVIHTNNFAKYFRENNSLKTTTSNFEQITTPSSPDKLPKTNPKSFSQVNNSEQHLHFPITTCSVPVLHIKGPPIKRPLSKRPKIEVLQETSGNIQSAKKRKVETEGNFP